MKFVSFGVFVLSDFPVVWSFGVVLDSSCLGDALGVDVFGVMFWLICCFDEFGG